MKAGARSLIIAALLLPSGLASAQGSGRGVSVSGSLSVPDTHRVEAGDTLWDITDRYYGNPWEWPRVWSYNPDITNPHWIYPGDAITLRAHDGGAQAARLPTLDSGAQVRSRPMAEAVWLRQEGFLDRETLEAAAVIAGSPEEKIFLSTYDRVYLRFDEDAEAPTVGQELTVYRRHDAAHHEPDDDGELVRILGSVRVDSYDPEQRVARGVITECLDPIERGFGVAPMERALTMVPPRANERDIEAKIIAALRPVALLGSEQIAFIDAGEAEGVAVGNRFFLLRSGDAYRDTNEFRRATGESVDDVPELERYPEEIVGEGRVVHVRGETSTILIYGATKEVAVGERAVMRAGF